MQPCRGWQSWTPAAQEHRAAKKIQFGKNRLPLAANAVTTSEPWEGTGKAPGAAHGAEGFITWCWCSQRLLSCLFSEEVLS